MADHRSDGLAREVFRLHESENPPAIRRGARGYTRKHMSVMTSAKVNRSNDRRPLPHDPIPEKDQSWKKTHGESWRKTHGFVLGSQCALSRTSSASLCAMVEKKAETAREALPALVAQLSKQANVPDHALTKQYGQLRVLSGKVSYSDETMKAVAAEVKRLIEANRTQQIQDQMIKAAPSPTKMMQTITRTAPRFHQDSPVQHVSMMSGPLRRWTSAASFSPNAVGSNSWAKILAGLASQKKCLFVHMSSAEDDEKH